MAFGHHHLIDKIAVWNGVVSGLVLYPQIALILFWHVPNNISVITLGLLVLNNIVWTMYGIHRSLASITIAATLNVLAGTILLFI